MTTLLNDTLWFYRWGCTPDPVPKAYIKTQKFYGILGVILPEGNFRNPFGVRRVPSEPVSVISVVKNPASNSHFEKILSKYTTFHHFLSLLSNGDSPPSYSYLVPRFHFEVSSVSIDIGLLCLCSSLKCRSIFLMSTPSMVGGTFETQNPSL